MLTLTWVRWCRGLLAEPDEFREAEDIDGWTVLLEDVEAAERIEEEEEEEGDDGEDSDGVDFG